MIDAVAFRTRARTIDHLGREQIADCPTAISELWKNAYDAYAHSVALHIFDGEPAIATVVDDGHGMSRDEFVDRWLTVGTESKLTGGEVRKEDRNGLPFRAKQGQKGIGRLSAAAMGPLLLVVSKRRIARFVAALIDWRLFENPFLYLQDVEIPVVEFDEKEELFQELPGLFDTLMGNLWGSGKDSDRDRRIAEAWKQFDEWETAEGKPSTRSAMETVVIDTAFTARHLCEWPVWGNEADSGTLLAVSDIGFDLLAQLDTRGQDDSLSSVKQARDRLFQTLSNFSDPYLDNEEERSGYGTGGLNLLRDRLGRRAPAASGIRGASVRLPEPRISGAYRRRGSGRARDIQGTHSSLRKLVGRRNHHQPGGGCAHPGQLQGRAISPTDRRLRTRTAQYDPCRGGI